MMPHVYWWRLALKKKCIDNVSLRFASSDYIMSLGQILDIFSIDDKLFFLLLFKYVSPN